MSVQPMQPAPASPCMPPLRAGCGAQQGALKCSISTCPGPATHKTMLKPVHCASRSRKTSSIELADSRCIQRPEIVAELCARGLLRITRFGDGRRFQRLRLERIDHQLLLQNLEGGLRIVGVPEEG